MKNKSIRIIVVAFSFFIAIGSAYSQAAHSPVPGSKAPRLSGVKWLKGDPVVEWDPGRIYLVEFGATWCTPCAAAIPRLTALQNKHRSDLVVISLFVKERNKEALTVENPAYVRNVAAYIKKKSDKINYRVAVDNPQGDLDNQWLRPLGLNSIPQMFIIDRTGNIRWVGSDIAEAEQRIERLQGNNQGDLLLSEKEGNGNDVIKYDRSKLLLIDDNGGGQTDFLFRSLLTKYNGRIFGANPESIQSYLWLKPDSVFDKYEDKVEIIGAPIGRLYYLAYSDTLSNVVEFRNYNYEFTDTIENPLRRKSYGKYWHEPVLEVSNEAPFQYSPNSARNRYNYSLKVPKGMGTARFLQSILRNDLENYFGFSATVETRIMPYWSLSVSDKKRVQSNLISKDQRLKVSIMDEEMPFVLKNAEMRDLIVLLASTYGYGTLDYGKLLRSEQGAFIDETGITESVDFTFDRKMTFDEMRLHLANSGLKLSREYKPMKVVVIRDPPHQVN